MFLWVIFCSKKLKNDWLDLSWRLYKPTMFLWVIFSSKKLKNDWLDLSWWLYKPFSGCMQGIGGRCSSRACLPCAAYRRGTYLWAPRGIYTILYRQLGGPTQSIHLTQQREGFDHDGFLLILVRYTCIARMRFGNKIMNKYHTITCKLWVIYAWCRCSFNSYGSSHPKSISFIKKYILRFMELCIVKHKVKTKSDNSFRKKKFGQLRYGRF